MKIFCIGRNYVAHIKELQNKQPDEPVVFTKPDSAVLKPTDTFYFPDFSRDIHHEIEIVLRIGKAGKYINEKFAESYIDGIGLGIDFTARDLQKKAKDNGLPWAIAKGFHGSAPLSSIKKMTAFENIHDLNFKLDVNGKTRQQGNTSMMIFSYARIISYLSTFFLLKKGDLIYTGTPEGVGPVSVGDTLEGYLENEKVLHIEVK